MIDIKGDPDSLDLAFFITDATIEDYCTVFTIMTRKLGSNGSLDNNTRVAILEKLKEIITEHIRLIPQNDMCII